MKSILRFALGLISSFLLAGGFSRAAEKFDPLHRGLGRQAHSVQLPAPDTISECTFGPSERDRAS